MKYVLLFILFSCCSSKSNYEFHLDGIETILAFNADSDYLAILVHGSGKQDIHGFTFINEFSSCEYHDYGNREFKIFDELSANLYRNGFSTLRYAKINTREAEKSPYLVKDFIQDLHYIITEVQKHPVLGKKKIVLFGWSEGVTVALNQLTFDHRIHGIIGYGGIFVDPVQLKTSVYYDSILRCESDPKKALAHKKQILAQTTSQNSTNDNSDKEIIIRDTLYNGDEMIGVHTTNLNTTPRFWSDFKKWVTTSNQLITHSDTPILLLFGETDVNVPIVNYNYLVKSAQNKNVSLRSVKNTDHLFRKSFATEMNPQIFDIIRTWQREI